MYRCWKIEGVMVMVFNATFNNISVICGGSVLLVEETGENHWPATSHWQTWSHNVISIERLIVISPFMHGISCLVLHTVSNSIFFENLEEVTFLGGFIPNLLLSGSMMNMLILYISARYFCDPQNPLICHLKYSSLWSFIQFSCHVCHQYLIFVPFSSSCLKEPSLFYP